MLDASESPVFVVGSSRSGTTLLRNMLSAHPRVHLTHEASFYLHLAVAGRSGEVFVERYLTSFSYRWLRQDPRPVLSAIGRPFPIERAPELFTAIMRTAAAEHGKMRWGDKTPLHATHVGRMLADYPNARIVRMVRHPATLAASLARMPWFSPSPVAAAAAFGAELRAIEKVRDRILEVRLEDLQAEPRATIGRVLDFIGEPWNDQVLDHSRFAPDDVPPLPWFERARGPRASAREVVDPVHTRLIEVLARSSMVHNSYAPLPLASEPSRLAVFWRCLSDLPVAAKGVWLALKLARTIQGDLAGNQRTERLLRRLNPEAWAAHPGLELPEAPPLPEDWRSAW